MATIRETARKRLMALKQMGKKKVGPLNAVPERPAPKKTLMQALSPSAQAIKDRQEYEKIDPEGNVKRGVRK